MARKRLGPSPEAQYVQALERLFPGHQQRLIAALRRGDRARVEALYARFRRDRRERERRKLRLKAWAWFTRASREDVILRELFGPRHLWPDRTPSEAQTEREREAQRLHADPRDLSPIFPFERALDDLRLKPEDVDALFAHGDPVVEDEPVTPTEEPGAVVRRRFRVR